MEHATLQQTLEAVEALPADERRVLIELVGLRLAEEFREEVARNASRTLRAVRTGRASIGRSDDFRQAAAKLR